MESELIFPLHVEKVARNLLNLEPVAVKEEYRANWQHDVRCLAGALETFSNPAHRLPGETVIDFFDRSLHPLFESTCLLLRRLTENAKQQLLVGMQR